MSAPPSRLALGRNAEARIERLYASAGFRPVARNVRVGPLEIDLILERAGTYVFCEVRCRADARFGHPAETVDAAKRARVRRAAARWLEQEGIRAAARFDVATVVGHGEDARVSLYPNAF